MTHTLVVSVVRICIIWTRESIHDPVCFSGESRRFFSPPSIAPPTIPSHFRGPALTRTIPHTHMQHPDTQHPPLPIQSTSFATEKSTSQKQFAAIEGGPSPWLSHGAHLASAHLHSVELLHRLGRLLGGVVLDESKALAVAAVLGALHPHLHNLPREAKHVLAPQTSERRRSHYQKKKTKKPLSACETAVWRTSVFKSTHVPKMRRLCARLHENSIVNILALVSFIPNHLVVIRAALSRVVYETPIDNCVARFTRISVEDHAS